MRWLLVFAASAASLLAQTAAPNDSGVSIGHMHLILGDPDAHQKLWVGVLGAEVTNAGTLEMLRLPGVFIVLGKARTPPAEGTDGSTVNHFGFLVKSAADTKAKLIAAGVTSFPIDRPEQKQFIADFPEKVRVEFTEDSSLKVPIAFHHIHIATTDVDSLRAWYVKTFGAKAGKRGDFLAAMLPGGEVDFRKADAAPAPTKGRSLDHIGPRDQGLGSVLQKAAGRRHDLRYGVPGNAAAWRVEDRVHHRSSGDAHRTD